MVNWYNFSFILQLWFKFLQVLISPGVPQLFLLLSLYILLWIILFFTPCNLLQNLPKISRKILLEIFVNLPSYFGSLKEILVDVVWFLSGCMYPCSTIQVKPDVYSDFERGRASPLLLSYTRKYTRGRVNVRRSKKILLENLANGSDLRWSIVFTKFSCIPCRSFRNICFDVSLYTPFGFSLFWKRRIFMHTTVTFLKLSQ